MELDIIGELIREALPGWKIYRRWKIYRNYSRLDQVIGFDIHRADGGLLCIIKVILPKIHVYHGRGNWSCNISEPDVGEKLRNVIGDLSKWS